jgi:hypothetical protein
MRSTKKKGLDTVKNVNKVSPSSAGNPSMSLIKLCLGSFTLPGRE